MAGGLGRRVLRCIGASSAQRWDLLVRESFYCETQRSRNVGNSAAWTAKQCKIRVLQNKFNSKFKAIVALFHINNKPFRVRSGEVALNCPARCSNVSSAQNCRPVDAAKAAIPLTVLQSFVMSQDLVGIC